MTSTHETIERNPARDLKVGDTVRLIVPGVPEWKIPATESIATLTADNICGIRADIAETLANLSDAVLIVNNEEVTK